MRSVKVQRPSVVQGGSLAARVTVADVSRRAARKTKLTILLSTDARRDARDRQLATVKVPALKRGKRKVLTASVTVPLTATAGSYRLLACLGKRCRASAAFSVTARSAPFGPVVPGVPGPVTPAPAPEPTPSPPAVPGEDPAAVPPAGNPLNVTPVAEADRAVTKRMSSAVGGSITATAADGATFTLTFPAGGLFEDEEITLTPLSDLDGLSFAAIPTSVDIQPHGLVLAKGATLRITPAAPIAVADQFVFAAREGGKDVHAYPPTSATDVIELPLTHFSIYGAAPTVESERLAAGGALPADAMAQIEQAFGEMHQEAKRAGKNVLDDPRVAQVLREWFADIVRPRLIAAETDDTLAVLAVTSFGEWVRGAELIGASIADLVTEGRDRATRAIEYAYKTAFGRCLNRELAYASAMIDLARMAQLQGLLLGDTELSRFAKCARFKLVFEVRLRQDNTQVGYHWDTTVKAQEILLVQDYEVSNSLQGFSGEQPPTVQTWDFTDDDADCPFIEDKVEIVAPVRITMQLGLSSRIETARDGRTRYVLTRDRPQVEVNPGWVELWLNKACFDQPRNVFEGEYSRMFNNTWVANAQPHTSMRLFTSFFEQSLPKLALFLEDRTVVASAQTTLISRLRMEIEHFPDGS